MSSSKRTWIRLANVAFKAILSLSLATLQFPSTARAGKEATPEYLADGYLHLAFVEGSKLQKFSRVPQMEFICNPISACNSVVKEVMESIPKEFSVLRSNSRSGRSEIEVHLTKSSDDLPLKEYVSEMEDLYKIATHHQWGPTGCEVHQFKKGEEIQKLLVIVDLGEDPTKNLFCILFEVARGSGGVGSMSYERYTKRLSKENSKVLRAFRQRTGFFLKVHWSSVLHPGMTAEEARDRLITYIRKLGGSNG